MLRLSIQKHQLVEICTVAQILASQLVEFAYLGGILLFFDVFSKLCEESGTTPNAVAKKLNLSSGGVTEWKNGRTPRGETLKKIADYFNVSVDYLLGNTDIKEKPSESTRTVPTDEDIMFALFEGEQGVTDEMYEEVKRFARYVKETRKNGKDT